jgi:hypothetical protein
MSAKERSERYKSRYHERIRALNPCDVSCIYCSSPLTHGHGFYPRKPYTFEGWREEWDIHRRYCPQCHRTFGLLPSHLSPYARYTIDVQDAATSSVGEGRGYEQISSTFATQGVTVEPPTIRRWFHRFRDQVRQVLPTLSSRLQQAEPSRALPPLRGGVRDVLVCCYYDRLPLLGSSPHSGAWNLLRQIVCLFAPPVSVNRVSYGLFAAPAP